MNDPRPLTALRAILGKHGKRHHNRERAQHTATSLEARTPGSRR